ncbi:hypothetical protein [Profundibacterium mesophilum]|uniref:Uncharacterized protein n=1 Tax=Profundibacterium mesophilum KAUST100406-0324 TaxID=1037889 RepID=A0A921TDZ5_9RHOB|nr:hypothetical protein [Profundibacterium mesophilum]KAF0677323.1 hypothetical protein PMES_00370 [Profundibacterium mesophilum KAUST100406-0324]
MRLRIGEHLLRRGVFEARIEGGDPAVPPDVALCHRGRPIEGATFAPDETVQGAWRLSVPLPAHLIDDGVQSLSVIAQPGAERLGGFEIAAGTVLEAELRGELERLSAELDLLKRAFRRSQRS